MNEEVVVFWFRRDLRINDNTGFYYALKSGTPVLPVFIFDSNILEELDKDDPRVMYLHQRLQLIHSEFRAIGSNLIVRKGNPLEIFNKLFDQYNIQGIYTNRDYEPYARERDGHIANLAREHGAGFYDFKDQVIFEQGEIHTDAEQPYKVFTPFKRKWMERFENIKQQEFDSQHHLQALFKEDEIDFQSLDSIGFSPSRIEIPPLEFPVNIIKSYGQKRNFPSVNGTSRLGIHLRHGAISIRDAVSVGRQYSDTWLNELIWREFYMMILAHFPHVVNKAFKPQYDQIPWRNSKEDFEKWCQGNTGYPIVDAGMRELNTTGYMHNRVRMITASFLTKHLLIDWRWGEAYFAKKLLDFELSSNNGGWQWAAGTGTDAQPYFRVFNPTSQLEKFDKNMRYVNKWVPEIKQGTYPEPMVDHKFARTRAIDTYKAALS
jgi:deoxyribodipyrimidine photo-lyase